MPIINKAVFSREVAVPYQTMHAQSSSLTKLSRLSEVLSTVGAKNPRITDTGESLITPHRENHDRTDRWALLK